MPALYMVYWFKGHRKHAVPLASSDEPHRIYWDGVHTGVLVQIEFVVLLLAPPFTYGALDLASIPIGNINRVTLNSLPICYREITFTGDILGMAIFQIQGDSGTKMTLEWLDPTCPNTIDLVAAASAAR